MRKKHEREPHSYYVYALNDESGIPFYIGKGYGNRKDSHERDARRGEMEPRHKKIRSIWARGNSISKAILFDGLTEEEAFRIERETIAVIGRSNLCNCTDGGEGPSGARHSQEWKEAMSRRFKGRTMSKGRKLTSDQLAALRAERASRDWSSVVAKVKAKGPYRRSEEWKKAQKGTRHLDEDARAKLRLSRSGGGKSGFSNVYPQANGYSVSFYRDMKKIHVGWFKSIDEAVKVRNMHIGEDGYLLPVARIS